MDDDFQLEELWNAVRYNVVVLDFYMNNFVFPRHAKQFKVKLQSNGWDIPLFQASDPLQDRRRGELQALTTGFSGTNDNRSMLPLTVRQQDLPRLSHTNAEVLTYLLHSRNRGYALILGTEGQRLSEEGFLHRLWSRGFKLLIDAGAQILEMDNLTLARTWLEVDHNAPAAMYFEQNKPWIINRAGGKTPLIASVYADDLKDCLVYIDEVRLLPIRFRTTLTIDAQAHTRGTDLKLPVNARGALTLGLGQTKDHTVQGRYSAATPGISSQALSADLRVAALRLRQLASTQSITFFAPPEVNQSILDLRKKTSSSQIDSHDV